MERPPPADRPARTRDRLVRLEARFLRPHRLTVVLALVGMLGQSLLALPVPLLQGWVLDRLVAGPGVAGAGGAASLRWVVVWALAGSVLCYLLRMALLWRVTSVMTRVSLEVVRDLTDALHR